MTALRACRIDLRDEMVGVLDLVRDGDLCHQALDGVCRAVEVSNPTGRENGPQGIGQGIDRYVQFDRQSTSRRPHAGAECLRALQECWWVRTMVDSMNSFSRRASRRKASVARYRSPRGSERVSRTYSECQLPNSFGGLHQRQQGWATCSTASTRRLLSAVGPPISIGLPGRKSAISAHSVSRNVFHPCAICKFLDVDASRPVRGDPNE